MSKKCMFNHMDDFSILNRFGINTISSKVFLCKCIGTSLLWVGLK